MDERFAQLAGILGDVLKVPAERIQPGTRLFEDLNANSMDATLIVLEIEERFNVLVPDRGRTYRTAGDLHAHLEELLARDAAHAARHAAVGQEA